MKFAPYTIDAAACRQATQAEAACGKHVRSTTAISAIGAVDDKRMGRTGMAGGMSRKAQK